MFHKRPSLNRFRWLLSRPPPPLVTRILIGFGWFWIRICWKWVGIDGKGYANTTYISEFHPHIPKPWFRNISFCILSYFTYFETPNRVSRVLPEKCLTGVGYIEADWKVSASKNRNEFGSMDRKFENWSSTFFDHQIIDFRVMGFWLVLTTVSRESIPWPPPPRDKSHQNGFRYGLLVEHQKLGACAAQRQQMTLRAT